ncbi:hypothetical protein M9458_035054, partial [Cirrhinus mrigala]
MVGELEGDSIHTIQSHRTSATLQDPEPRQPSPLYMDMTPEPTTMKVPEVVPEPKPHKMFDQVCEPATPCIAVGLLMDFEGMKDDPAYIPTTQNDLNVDSEHYDLYKNMEVDILLNLSSLLVPPSTMSPVSSLYCPPWVFQLPAQSFISAPPVTPPSLGSNWNHHPNSTIGLPRPPWSDVAQWTSGPPSLQLHLTPPFLWLCLGPQSHRLHYSPLAPLLHLGFSLALALPWSPEPSTISIMLSHQLVASAWVSTSTGSQNSTSSSLVMDHHPGCALGPH